MVLSIVYVVLGDSKSMFYSSLQYAEPSYAGCKKKLPAKLGCAYCNNIIFTLFYMHRFCVAVRRKNYPTETTSLTNFADNMSRWIQPAHTISFVPPVTIVNLLPCHLNFRIIGLSKSSTDVSPGKKSFVSVSIVTQGDSS